MGMMNLLTFPHKAFRSKIIKQYMEEAGYTGAVCLTCGNAGRELRALGVDTVIIGETGDLSPNRWLSTAEVHRLFPDRFDATSGHLNMELMNRIAEQYRKYLGKLDSPQYIPSGSGECLTCLKLAYPDIEFIAVYNVPGELAHATEYSEYAPLNGLVRLLAKDVKGVKE